MLPTRQYTLREIAARVGVEFSPAEAGDNIISGLASLESARSHQIAFLDNPAYRKYLAHTEAAAVVLAPQDAALSKVPVLISKSPYLVYAKVAELFNHRERPPAGIHPTAVIGQNCQIDPTACISAFCYIGDNSEIGADVCLWPHVVVYDRVVIGARTVIHSGAVIGSDGFGNARDPVTMAWHKVPQLGRVVIGKDVEIGANTTIDRGALGDTVIEDGVRLDNHIQVAHNVHIGAHTAIAACTGIAGSAKIGKYCMIGGHVGIGGHLEITDGVGITGKTGVSRSISERGVYSGEIAQKNREWRKMIARLRHLDELFDRVTQLEKLAGKSDGN